MKPYIRIAHKLYCEPWLILPSAHRSYAIQFEKHLAHGAKMEIPSDDAATSSVSVSNGIAVVPIYGGIGNKLSLLETMCGGVDCEALGSQLKALRDDPEVSSIVLDFDSPGGTVTGVPELAQLISSIDAVKPVYAFCSGQMCSAAYWLGSQARAILVSPSSIIGSVGAYIYHEDHSKELEQQGIKATAIVSEGSTMKLAGADFKPLTKDEKAFFQDSVNQTNNEFKAAIASKRSVNADYLDGRAVKGEEAVTGGLADGLANDLEEVLKVIA